ncbi:elongation factor P maturation arginine rhamnosyltransferase EarP [Pseudomonas huanghezhanensis]|uniref:elongation factor P maturation arginine rhamnosyltransferase EarP n=1 Tax=Pseudomonas huanghezhanensis TaxID=3002903 RepID=UPI0022853B02|nr:elongation factor P maturation arginine rhamnosyltransferase EarP [Pseudomonas sp. BSw22131]
MRASWDIFCAVVDNFGDVGVTFRLARQLVAEHGFDVRLWIDDLSAFARLRPGADSKAARQVCDGVTVCHWPAEWPPVTPADVVIEAFACRLPAVYLDAMLACEKRPLWFNLEYLSAEDWVPGCHGLPSIQSSGLRKYFFFPGFTDKTGGLLREAGLIAQRQAFQADAQLQRSFLSQLGIAPESGARLVSLFAYEHSGLGSWLDCLAFDDRNTHLLVPEGRIIGDVQRWLGIDELKAGDLNQRNALTVQVLPFVRQEDYDRLLWCCEFNVVRGEDSFIRAQWAGRPLIWHIYEQDDDAHWAKLDAFLELYQVGLSREAAQVLGEFCHRWNAGQDMRESWLGLMKNWPELSAHAERWCLDQALHNDLTTALVSFYRNSL